MKSFLGAGTLVFTIALFGGLAYFAGRTSKPLTISSLGPTIEEVRSLAELVTTKTTVSDVLVAESDSHMGSWLIKGDVLLGIDLENAEVVDKDEEGHTATILLPPPHVVMARVDHERTMTWNVKKVTWLFWKRDESPLRDDAMKQGQRLVEFAGNSESQLSSARRQAELVIEKLYKMVGWDVRIRWRNSEKKGS